MIQLYDLPEYLGSAPAEKPDTAGTETGYFRDTWDVEAGKQPTVIGAWWLDMVQEELLAALAACGISPDPDDDEQLGACFDTKLDKTGGTIAGNLTVEGSLTLDATDVATVAYDAPVTICRTVSACAGMRPNTADDAVFSPTYGGWLLATAGDMVAMPIEGLALAGVTLEEVQAHFLNPNVAACEVVVTVLRREVVLDTLAAESLVAVTADIEATPTNVITLDCDSATLNARGNVYAVITLGETPLAPILFRGLSVTYGQTRLTV